MKTYKQLTLPGLPSERRTDDDWGKSGAKRWYYVHDARRRRMRGLDADCADGSWYPLNLTDCRILLFSSRRQALDLARSVRGKVAVYPYDLKALRTRD